MNRSDGGPVFPQETKTYTHPPGEDLLTIQTYTGMSLRDWFATAALQGILATGDYDQRKLAATGGKAVAMLAYWIADALLREREQSRPSHLPSS